MAVRIQLDCRGLKCPQPVLKTKDALEQITSGEIEVTVDNEASRSNVERFVRSQGCIATVTESNGNFVILASKSEDAPKTVKNVDVSSFTCEPVHTDLIYVVPSNIMGQGNDDLGKVLIRAFVKTIKDVSPQPSKVLFFNTGVMITAMDSDLVQPLKDLEAKGVEIFSCGTCLDFLGLKDKLLVGKTTNMFEIMQNMANATKIVSPY